jgi:hypothetical protein
MTTTSTTGTTTVATSRTPVLAVLSLALSAVLTAIGTFWDLTGNDHGSGNELGPYLFAVGIAAVACLIVFGLVVRRAERGHPGRRSAILGVLGVLAIPVFWTGLPPVLAIGAVATALTDRDVSGRFRAASKAGLGLAGIALAATVALAIVG